MPTPLSPQPGLTYIIHTTEPRTIVFTFVGLGEYLVDGRIRKVPSYSDLAAPYAVRSGPFLHLSPR